MISISTRHQIVELFIAIGLKEGTRETHNYHVMLMYELLE